MSHNSYFETGVTRDGTRYVARLDGEYCGAYHCEKAAQEAIKLKEKAEKAAHELDRAARPYFCDGRHGVWRAVEYGQALPQEVERAFQAHHATSISLARHRGLA